MCVLLGPETFGINEVFSSNDIQSTENLEPHFPLAQYPEIWKCLWDSIVPSNGSISLNLWDSSRAWI